jgi:hypothetical protein
MPAVFAAVCDPTPHPIPFRQPVSMFADRSPSRVGWVWLAGVGSWLWPDLVQQTARHGGRAVLAGVPALGLGWLAGDFGRHD